MKLERKQSENRPKRPNRKSREEETAMTKLVVNCVKLATWRLRISACSFGRKKKGKKKEKKSQFSCARLLLSPSLQLSSMTMSSLGDASFVHSGGGGWARGGGGGDGGGATRAAASLFNIFNIVPRCWPHAIHIEIIEIIWAPILSTPQILKTAKKKIEK